MAENTANTIQERPPIITIMGHIDHGKTSLLDYIRESRVTSREAGGITQHVGAYQVHNGRTLTFIDTPGHEAFQAIRTRGIKTSDILVIVIAADEGIKPQTEESIQNAKATGLPIVVALTKIDKEETNVDKIKADLAERELTPEEWGGETVVTALSSVTGEGVDTFLEMLTLVTEVNEITANYNPEYTDGFVLESFLDSKAGPLCDVIVQNGKLSTGDVVLVGTQTYGKARRMNNPQGEALNEAHPGQPVRILGLKNVAEAGSQFRVVESEREAQNVIEEHTKKPANEPVMQFFMKQEKNELNLILKADSGGSLEAIEYALDQIVQEEIEITILNKSVGQVTASDIQEARAEDALILAFGVKENKKTMQMAERQNVRIKHYRLIYELTDEIRDLLEKMQEPKIQRNDFGNLNILRVFKEEKKSIILGGRVTEGKMKKGSLVEISNGEEVIIRGKMAELQHNKEPADEVEQGRECGIRLNIQFKNASPKDGHTLYSYEEVTQEL